MCPLVWNCSAFHRPFSLSSFRTICSKNNRPCPKLSSTGCDLKHVLQAFFDSFCVAHSLLDVVEHIHEEDLEALMRRYSSVPALLEKNAWWYVPDKFANRNGNTKFGVWSMFSLSPDVLDIIHSDTKLNP